MDDGADRPAGKEVESGDKKPAPAANDEQTIQKSEPAPEDETDEKKCDSRLALSHREAEIIAQNLKESGTRR
jgi:hypothetical protein